MRVEKIGRATLYLGDCEAALESIPRFDAVITSPPYNLAGVKKGSFYDGKSKGEAIAYNTYSDDLPMPEYIDWQHRLFGKWYARLSDAGVIAYNHKPRTVGGVYDDRRGLIPIPIRQELIWDRCAMINFSGSFFAPQYEVVFLCAKEGWRPQKPAVGWGNIWRIAAEPNSLHPAPFPLALAKRLVEGCTAPDSLIYDPFTGSGTTAIAAVQAGRDFVGSEIDPTYFDIACKRIEDAQRQGNLFDAA
jgi:modification methylase